jgi:site-specific DNA recombinase
MKTAVIYARYSSDSQTEQSIEGQLRVCEQYAKNNDFVILNTYIDRAMTGTNDNRPDFQKMIKDSSNKEFEFIIVYKLDRFSRNKYETAKYKKILKDNGVKLVSAMENIPDTPEGIILESLLEGMAEYYSAELAQKVKRGMHETRLKGNYQGGGLPYGYKIDGKKIVIDDTKVDTVRYIFKQYAMGKSVNEIINELIQMGIYCHSKNVCKNTIYNMLKNERYIGKYTKDNEVYTNMFPRIIDDETFAKVKARRGINHYGKKSIQTIYLFKNKLVCGYCGKSISAECCRNKYGKKTCYYKCIGIKKYRNGCIKKTIRQEILEKYLFDTILTELSKPKVQDKMVKILMDIQNTPKTNSNLNLLIKTKKQMEITLNNILLAVEQGVVNKTTNNRMKELEQQIEDLDRQILVEQSKTTKKISEEDIRKFYTEMLKQEPLMIIDNLIKQIRLYNDKAQITFNTPTLQSPDNKGSFLTFKNKMKKIIQNKPQPIYIDMTVEFYV